MEAGGTGRTHDFYNHLFMLTLQNTNLECLQNVLCHDRQPQRAAMLEFRQRAGCQCRPQLKQ